MNLMAVNLQRASAISTAIYGNFSGPKHQEIAVAKGSTLELLSPNDAGQMITVCSTPVFSTIRSLLSFRLSGSNRDYVLMGTDSGRISVLEYDAKLGNWKLVHCETMGKTGCRRIVPGQYLAADPKGRAVLVGAIEKQKFVYIMNRDTSTNKLTISSPLEAHKSETLLFSSCGVDVGFENPVFALLELEYTEADQDPTGEAAIEEEKKLTYYELDLGLNHVVRKWSEPVSRTANFLLPVPGGDVWPSGVLICGENWVSYKHMGHVEIRTALPRRAGLPANRGVLITAGAVHKQKDLFFFILQSEYGDLYKVTMELSDPAQQDGRVEVTNLIVSLFDTIQPANSLCITKTGLLFAASEFANHAVFRFQALDDPDAVTSSRIEDDELNEELGDDSISASRVAPIFTPRDTLRNLELTSDIESLAPITDMLVTDISAGVGESKPAAGVGGEGTKEVGGTNEGSAPQIYALCGRGALSSLRILQRGVAVTEIAVSDMPGTPTAVWTVKQTVDDEFDRLIVVSFSNATLVLKIGENVEEYADSGFLENTTTLQAVLLADNALIQVHPQGIRHIRPDQRTSEWKAPGVGGGGAKKLIQHASANARQVAVGLAGGEVIYFELDAAGQLIEMGSIDMGKEISCLDVGALPEGRVRSAFLCVGCWDDTVQLLSLDPSDVLGRGPSFAVDSRPTSLCLIEMRKEGEVSGFGDVSSDSATTQTPLTLYLNVGLEKGVLLRVAVDPVTGDFTDARQKFLGGVAPLKLCRVSLQGRPAAMALSSKFCPWILYNYQHRYHQDPIAGYDPLEYAADFSSEACEDGIVAVSGRKLLILTVDNLGALFNQTSIPLRYTPRKICRIPQSGLLALIESDHNEFNQEERAQIEARDKGGAADSAPASASSSSSSAAAGEVGGVGGVGAESKEVNMKVDGAERDREENDDNKKEEEEEEEEEEEQMKLPLRGPMPAVDGKWASCIRIIDPKNPVSSSEGDRDGEGGNGINAVLELQNNEAAFSLCTCKFSAHSEETFLVVGTAQDLTLHPRKFKCCYLNVYRQIEGQLQLLHQTAVEDVPMAISEFQGRLLVGAGRTLRLYDLGKRKLLKKCENKGFPSAIVRLQHQGDRVFVADLCESVHLVKYRRAENVLSIFADDTSPRFMTGICVVDYFTVAGTDKFGNVFVLRLPEDADDSLSLGHTVANQGGGVRLWDQGLLNGAPNKVDTLTTYYLGETPTAIAKCAFKLAGREVLLVATITGGLTAFVPFRSKEEVSFFQHLEMFMRQEFKNLAGRDHLSYRSYFTPVKNTIDGDLCERFSFLSAEKQREFAEDVDRTSAEVLKKLDDIRDFV